VADYPLNATGAPVWVFTPTTVATNTLKITNIGSSPLYAAPLATLSTPGSYPAPIMPGQHLYLTSVTASTYVTAGYLATTVTTTLTATNSTAGSTNFTVASNASFPAGTLMLLGSVTSSRELLAVSGTTSTTVITTTTASLYDHNGSATVATATANFGQARILTGVI
jgi:hypothetical protein